MSTAKDQASGSFTMSGATRKSQPARWQTLLKRTALASGVALYTATALAGPQGGRVTHGDGNINRAGNGTTVINQRTHRMSIDWESFNVGANERVVFQQPSSSSTALNRIFDQNPSQIFGAVDANGRILLLNPNGILFGETARINIQSLVASSLELSLEDFKAGNYNLEALANSHGGAIINRGLIKAATGGSVSLIGDQVVNEGLIVADYGQINMAAGRQATLDFDGDGMLLFAVDAPVVENAENVDAAVANSGQLVADGGQILLAGNTARGVFGSVVNNEGSIRAMRVDDTGGVIRLMGNSGTVVNSGVVDAGSRTGVAGRVEITGDRVGLLDGSVVSASGRHGGGTVLVGGDKLGQNPDVQNSSITYVDEGARVEADARISGDGGRVIVFSDGMAGIYGELSAHGGELGGDGGFIETSGKRYINVTRAPDISAINGIGGTWLIDPFDIEIVAGNNLAEFDETVLGQDRTYDPNADTPPGTTSQLGVDIIGAALAIGTGATVTITTGVDGGDDGNITWTSGALLDYHANSTLANPDTLVLDAANDIIFEGNAADALISDGTPGDDDLLNLTLTAGGNVTFQSDATIDLNTGVLDITFGSDPAILAGTAGRSLTIAGNLTADAASVATGGIGDDAFVFDASFAGSANGGDGADTFALNAGTVGSVNGDGGDDQITLGGGSVGSIAGGGGTGDELVAAAAGSDFVVTGAANAGTVDLVAFTGVENLTGGAGADTFSFVTALSGTASGEAGDDEFTLNGGSAGDIVGGDDDDTLINGGTAVDFVVTGSADAGTVDATQSFSEIENLTGGSGNDTFEFVTALTGNASGAGGDDQFTLNGGSAGAIVGGGGTGDTLIGEATANAFVVTGSANAGTVGGTQAFSGIENLTGGAAGDTFEFVTALSGTASGAGGDDQFTLSGGSAGAIAGGGGTGDTLIGEATANAFVVSGAADAGTVGGTQAFSGIENLTGGAAGDTFEFVTALSGTANGAGGADEFTINGGSAGAIAGGTGTDELTGDDTANTWVVTGSANAGTLNGDAFSGIEDLTGGSAVDTFEFVTALSGTADGAGDADEFTINGGSAGAIVGGTGTDELIGDDTANTWIVTGSADTGTLNGDAFSSIETLTGGGLVDQFLLQANVTGDVTGGAGADQFTMGTVLISIGGTFDGGTGSDTLIGADDDNAWVVSGANAGTLNAQSFTGIENLTGGSAVDLFDLSAGLTGTAAGGGDDDIFSLNGGSAGNIDGNGGSDTLEGDDVVNTWTIASAGSGTVNAQSFDGIATLTGGSNTDTLVGADVVNAFDVLSADSGTLNTFGFSAIENLTGGSDVDNFDLQAALSGDIVAGGGDDVVDLGSGSANSIDGGADNDTLRGPNQNLTWSVDTDNVLTVPGGLAAGGVSNFEIFAGGSGIDTFNINANYTGDLSGGGGNDIFNLNTGTVTGTLLGDAGDDTFNVNGGSATAVDGGANRDTLFGNDILNAWLVNNLDEGTLTPDGLSAIAFTTLENLVGGGLVDNFLLQAELTGTVTGGAGDDVIDLDGGFASSYTGGTGSDTLQGDDDSNAWDVTSAGGGTLNGVFFAGIETASGGSIDDTFTINGGSVDTLDGGAGSDTLAGDSTINTFVVDMADSGTLNVTQDFANIENLTGGSNTDVFNVNAALSGNLDGGAGNDQFNITASVGGDVSGDAGNDEINVLATVGGDVNGGADDDTIDLTANVTGVVAGDAGDDLIILTGGGAASYDGGADSDTLIADVILNDWVVTGADDAGTLNAVAFTGIENLTGGGLIDTFVFETVLSGTASGGGGDDSFTLAGGSAGNIIGDGGTNTLTAANTVNTWDLTAANGGTLNGDAFSDIQNVIGGGDSDTFNISGGSAETLDGGAGDDTLAGDDIVNTFVVDMADSGTLNATQSFASIENLAGGSDVDTFNVNAALSGNLDGGAGNDQFNITASVGGDVSGDAGNDEINVLATVGGDVNGGADDDTIDLTANVTGAVAGDAGDDLIILTGGGAASYDGGADSDTLIADVILNDWVVTGADDAGTLNTVAFTGIENLTGGGLIDTFVFETVLSGTASGGDGDDSFTLAGGSAGNIIGDGGTNTLTAANTVNTWDLTAANGGTLNGDAFSDIQNVIGGGDSDTFNISGGSAETLDGGAGDDTLAGDDIVNTFVVDMADSGTLNATQSFASIENLAGGSDVDTFNVNAALSGNLDGGAGNDQFNITASVGGDVSGGDGNDSVILAAAVTGNVLGDAGMDTVTISGGSAAAIDGGADDDELVGDDTDNTWVVDSADGGTLNGLAFANVENLTGGTLIDTFALQAALSGSAAGSGGADAFDLAGGSAGAIDGGADTDTLTGDDVNNTWLLTAAGGGTLNAVAFGDVENLVGGSAADTFTLNGGSAGSYDGAGGSDELQGDDVANTFTVTAADAGTLNGAAFTGIETLSGGSMADVFTVSAGVTGDISGGDGADQFSVGGAVGGSVSGGAGDDLFTLLAGGSAAELNGGADNDRFNVQVGTFATPLVGGDGTDEVTFEDFAGANLLVDLSDTVYASFDIESVVGNGQMDSTLLSGNGNDVWQVDINGNGVLVTPAGSSTPVAFADFSVLDAGDGMADSLQGPDGVDQTWTVSSSGTLEVPFTILSQIANIEEFVGGDGVDTFEIAFDYVGNLSGGDGDDIFNIVGNVTGNLNGNGGSDTFNLQGGSATLLDGAGDGAGESDTLVGADTTNVWTITAMDSGDVNGQVFEAIENLLGGAVMDTFNLGAMVSGSVGGGAGNDMFLLDSDTAITVAGGIDGGDDDDMLVTTVVDGDRAFAFDGGAGNDSVTLNGGGAGYSGAFSDAAGTLAYTSAAQTVQTATLTGVETVFDEVVADTFTIDAGSQMAVDLSLGTTSGTDPLLADLGIVLDFSNKTNLDLNAPNAGLTLTGPIGIGGTLDLDASTLSSDGGTISAADLIIRNAMVMSALNTAVTTLSLDNVNGMFSLTDMGDLELLSSTAGGDITIEADGAVNVGAGETVASTGGLTLRSSGNTVTTDGTVSAADLTLDGATGLSIDGDLTGTNSLTLISGGTIDQAAGGSITSASVTTTSNGGLTLAGTGNVMAALNATNTGGAMDIVNGANSSMNLTNTGGAINVGNDGDLTLTGLSNQGGATDVNATGDLAMTGNINTGGGAMTLTGGGRVSQTGAVSAAGDIAINGDTYVAGSSATTTSVNGDVTIAGVNDITVNDVSALNGSVELSSTDGNIFAARPDAEIRSEDITFLNLGQVGTAETPFSVFGLDGTLNLDAPNNANPGIRLFINQLGKFNTIGPRAGNAVDQRAQAASAVFGQGLSATLSTGNAIDSSVFAEDLQVIGKVGRGVAIPCDQVEDEEEACQ